MTADDVRAIALELPEAVERDHHGRPSFRVDGRIFATLWTDDALNVMPGVDRLDAALARGGDACSPFYWGQRLRAVQVDLRAATPELVADLLADAWSAKAPRRLVKG